MMAIGGFVGREERGWEFIERWVAKNVKDGSKLLNNREKK